MLDRLVARLRDWGDALAGIDDPKGEYLLNLEQRIGRLEALANITPSRSDASGKG